MCQNFQMGLDFQAGLAHRAGPDFQEDLDRLAGLDFQEGLAGLAHQEARAVQAEFLVEPAGVHQQEPVIVHLVPAWLRRTS